MSKMALELFKPFIYSRLEAKGLSSTVKQAKKIVDIFFTGSPKIGRIVMEKAAKNLSTLTLELGGKNPNIIIRRHKRCSKENTLG